MLTLTLASLILIAVICPLVAVLGLSLGVIVSSRANDPRTAQQIGGLFVLPIIALVRAQLQGLYFLNLPAVMIAAVALAIIDLAVSGVGVALFGAKRFWFVGNSALSFGSWIERFQIQAAAPLMTAVFQFDVVKRHFHQRF